MRRLKLPIQILLLFAICFMLRMFLEAQSTPLADVSEPKRIVSLAPSITETLFAVGLGPQVVGVTTFCKYPPEVNNVPKVSGFSDLNLEALIRIRPDLVILPADKELNRSQIERMGIPVLTIETVNLKGLLAGIKSLSLLGEDPKVGRELLADIEDSINLAKNRAKGKERPSVLFAVMHSQQGLGYINEISAIGRDGFYDQLIEMAGGRNVYEGSLPYPRLSREAIILLNPNVIIDVLPDSENALAVRREWMRLASVNAIKNNRLLVLSDELHTIPGPRFVQTLRLMSLAFQPEDKNPNNSNNGNENE